MEPNKPVFCGQEPAFFGGFFDTEEEHSKKTAQAQRLGKNPVDENEDFFEIYFDGRLEQMIGFDLVCFVDGVMPKIKAGHKIECIAITPDDKRHDAIIHVHTKGKSKSLYCLIRLPNDDSQMGQLRDIKEIKKG